MINYLFSSLLSIVVFCLRKVYLATDLSFHPCFAFSSFHLLLWYARHHTHAQHFFSGCDQKKITPYRKFFRNLNFKNIVNFYKRTCCDIDDIRNLEDSPGFVFIDEECQNLIVVNDGGELARNIKQKKKSDVLQ